MSSTRQQIIDAIKVRLKTVVLGGTVTLNGASHRYSFTPKCIDIWRVTPIADAELPAVNLRDLEAAVSGGAEIGRNEHSLALSISVADSGDASPERLRTMLQDLAAALGSAPTFDGLVHRLLLTSHSLDSEQAEKRLSVGTLTYTILYRTQPHTL